MIYSRKDERVSKAKGKVPSSPQWVKQWIPLACSVTGADQDESSGDEFEIGEVTIVGDVGEVNMAGRDIINNYQGMDKEKLREAIEEIVPEVIWDTLSRAGIGAQSQTEQISLTPPSRRRGRSCVRGGGGGEAGRN